MLRTSIRRDGQYVSLTVAEAISIAKSNQQVNIFGDARPELEQVRAAVASTDIRVSEVLYGAKGSMYIQLSPSGFSVDDFLAALQS